jgi:ribosomal protein L7/L12
MSDKLNPNMAVAILTALKVKAQKDPVLAASLLDAVFTAIDGGDPISAPVVPTLTPFEIAQCLVGHKIAAIKEFRARTGFGLVESKKAIDAWCQDYNSAFVAARDKSQPLPSGDLSET